MELFGWREKIIKDIQPFRMVDVTDKENIQRQAEARGKIWLNEETLKAIINKKIQKGDPLAVAEIASIMAVKRTPEIIPFCHPIPITSINTTFNFGDNFVEVCCCVKAIYKTGVEMEALAGVMAALLNIWDMVKYLEKDEAGQYPSTIIYDVTISEKKKG